MRLTSRRNPIVLHMKELGARRDYRRESGEFLCDGMKLLEEAVNSGARVTAVLTSTYIPFPLEVETRVYQAPRDIINSVSPLKNAQDTVFTCELSPKGGFPDVSRTSVLLDGIQDPGNLGTIIRTAHALGISGVCLTGDCADPYNPKTIRATMGAIFKQKIYNLTLSEISALKESGARIVGAVCKTEDSSGVLNAGECSLVNAMIAIGSEGHGLSPETLALCNETVTIPISPDCESLNAATASAILMWEAVRIGFKG